MKGEFTHRQPQFIGYRGWNLGGGDRRQKDKGVTPVGCCAGGKRGFWGGIEHCSPVRIKKSSNGEDISQKVGVILSYLVKSGGFVFAFAGSEFNAEFAELAETTEGTGKRLHHKVAKTQSGNELEPQMDADER